MIPIKQDIKGKINNLKLTPSLSHSLFPLFEAVVNAIDSLSETDSPNKTINITIQRDEKKPPLDLVDKESNTSIIGFLIEDTGNGFNEDNFDSFCTSDSTFKLHKGCKGLGRFTWLKVFDTIKIDSIFLEEGILKKRIFEFSEKGIKNIEFSELETATKTTTIFLTNIKSQYQAKLPQKTITIAHKIIEHCLSFFLLEDMPTITLSDLETKIILNDVFETKYNKDKLINVINLEFNNQAYTFKVLSMKVFSKTSIDYKIHYIANNREVKAVNLKNDIPELKTNLKDDNGNSFSYKSFISGNYFDNNVNSERTDFTLPSQGGTTPSFDDIHKKVLSNTKDELNKYLEPLREENKEFIRKYINEESPQYKHILKYGGDKLDALHQGMKGEDIELELFKIEHELDLEIKKESKNIFKTDADYNSKDYQNKYQDFFEKVIDSNKTKLSDYIIHRKIILEMYEKALQYNGNYEKEETIHKIIYPMNETSDHIQDIEHNLWLIDERLSYHYFLASDKPMSQISEDLENKKRPDLIVFNKPNAFADEENDFTSIVIIEFKRPMRDDYSDTENPIRQVLGYIDDINSGKIKTLNGRPIDLRENTPFYVYIICDITPKLRKEAKAANFKVTPDSKGYFYFHNEYYNTPRKSDNKN